ncbi:MAG: tetratricopeptide repeat protein, partial [Bryobacteraceae bacterium]
IYYILGNSYFTMGKFDRSEAAYRKAIELNPKEPDYYENLATLLRKEGPGRLDEAMVQLQRAAEFAPSDPRLSLQLGLSYEAKGDWKEAASLLEKTVREQPGLVPAHVALARVYFHLGKRPEGLREKALIASLEEKKQQQRLGARRAESAHVDKDAIVDDRIQ